MVARMKLKSGPRPVRGLAGDYEAKDAARCPTYTHHPGMVRLYLTNQPSFILAFPFPGGTLTLAVGRSWSSHWPGYE